MRKYLALIGLVAVLGLCAASAQESEKQATPATAATESIFPPCVVKTIPADKEVGVDFRLTEIKVTFDRPMVQEKSWSWIMCPDLGAYPGYRGAAEPRWEDEGRTCVLPVKLAPGTVYAVGANTFRHKGFRDAKDNKVAMPYVWVFKTKE